MIRVAAVLCPLPSDSMTVLSHLKTQSLPNLGFARMSMFEVEKAPENICVIRRGLASKLAAAGRSAPPSFVLVESCVGMGLTLERR